MTDQHPSTGTLAAVLEVAATAGPCTFCCLLPRHEFSLSGLRLAFWRPALNFFVITHPAFKCFMIAMALSGFFSALSYSTCSFFAVLKETSTVQPGAVFFLARSGGKIPAPYRLLRILVRGAPACTFYVLCAAFSTTFE